MTTALTIQEKTLQDYDVKLATFVLPEVRAIVKVIAGIGLIDLLLGVTSLLLALSLHSLSLFYTGVLSLLTFKLLLMIGKQILNAKSWGELGVISMCGIYLPCFITWLSASNLFEVVL